MKVSRSKAVLLAACACAAALGLGGCVRHGCVRNSDCNSKFECVDGRCAPRSAGDAAVSNGAGGESGAQSGASGGGTAGARDAGSAGKLDAGKPRDGGEEHG